eukprot:12572658-Alexandrium_andersonii.AAC.1
MQIRHRHSLDSWDVPPDATCMQSPTFGTAASEHVTPSRGNEGSGDSPDLLGKLAEQRGQTRIHD